VAPSELEQALDEAAEGSGRTRRRVYELLTQASLYVEPAGRPEQGLLTLSTAARAGAVEMTAFTSLAQTLARDMDIDIRWARAPATWIFSEAIRLGCAAVRLNPPQFEIPSADLPALAAGRVPDFDSRKANQPAAPKVLEPRGPIPVEAGTYLEVALGGVNEVTAAYLFDLVLPGEQPMLCLGLRLDLPPERWDDFVASIEQLAEIPGFPDGVAACPLNDEMLAAAEKAGVKILQPRGPARA